MFETTRSLPLFCAAVLLAASAPARAQLWDRNLIVNPGAETGSGAASRASTPVADVPGWTRAGSFTVGQYAGGMPITDSTYGPEDRGKNYFLGGTGGVSSASQTISLSNGAAEIDAGRVRFYLSGFLCTNQIAPPKLRAAFLDAQDRKLLEFDVNGPAPDEDDGLLWRAGSGFVPPDTRKVVILLDLAAPSLAGGSYNSAGADNLALVLRLEPVFGANLVVNGDAELPENATSSYRPTPGWNGQPEFTAQNYDSDLTLVPDNPGKQHFGYPRANSKPTTAYQSIDVTLAKDRIDAGGVNYAFSAWLGGEGNQESGVAARLEFFGDANRSLGTSQTIGPVTLQNRGGKAGMLKRSTEGAAPAGTRKITVTLLVPPNSGVSATPYADNVALTLSSAGAVAIKEDGVVNAATDLPGPVAPGEVVTIRAAGINLSDTTRFQLEPDGRMATALGAVRVFFGGTQAPLLYVNSSQIGAIVPFDAEGKSSVPVRVEYKGVPSAPVAIAVAATAPGIFTADGRPKGPGLIVNADYSANSKENPVAEGAAAILYWTGGGQTDPGGVDGRFELPPLSRPKAPVSVSIGGRAAEVRYAGAVPYGWSGLLMAEVVVPAGSGSTDPVPVVITAGSACSPDNSVTMYVKQP